MSRASSRPATLTQAARLDLASRFSPPLHPSGSPTISDQALVVETPKTWQKLLIKLRTELRGRASFVFFRLRLIFHWIFPEEKQTKRFQWSKSPRGWAAGERVGGGGHAQPADDVGIIVARSCTGCVHAGGGAAKRAAPNRRDCAALCRVLLPCARDGARKGGPAPARGPGWLLPCMIPWP